MQHPDWPIKIVAAKYNAVETAWKIADRALEVSGGFGMFKKSEMERLFRDARAGRFHPANSSLTHELIGKLALGHQPRRSAALGIARRATAASTKITKITKTTKLEFLVIFVIFVNFVTAPSDRHTPNFSGSQMSPSSLGGAM